MPEFWEARTFKTEERTEYLGGWVMAFSEPVLGAERWEGVWTDGNSGLLWVMEAEEAVIVFSLEVVRRPSAAMGQVAGVAHVVDGVARFATTATFTGAEAAWTLRRRGPLIEVSTEGKTTHFAGAGAYFDGGYVRVGPLSDADRERLMMGD